MIIIKKDASQQFSCFFFYYFKQRGFTRKHLRLSQLTEAADGAAGSGGGNGGEGVGTTGRGLLAGLARPDADDGALDRVLQQHNTSDLSRCSLNRSPYLAAEGAGVAGVLGDFHLLDLLAERGTIAGTVLGDNSKPVR